MAASSSSKIPAVKTPCKPTDLLAFLNDNFPSRYDYPDWLLDDGVAVNHNLKSLLSILREAMPLQDADTHFFMTIESIIHDWYAVGRPDLSEPAKLRFFSFKLTLHLQQLDEENCMA